MTAPLTPSTDNTQFVDVERVTLEVFVGGAAEPPCLAIHPISGACAMPKSGGISASRCDSGEVSQIRAPAIVLHARNDDVVPIEHGEALSAALPTATLAAFEQNGHAGVSWPWRPERLQKTPC